MKLKIYTLDLSWRGCVVVTASSIEEAKEKIRLERDEIESELHLIQEHELDKFTYVNFGDE